MKNKLNILLFTFFACLFSNLYALSADLRIMETTDIHMNLLSYDYYQDHATPEYGLERTATLIKLMRESSANNVLIDNGDLLQGTPLGDYIAKIKPLTKNQIHPAYLLMNNLKYDVANLGNHDFNYGLSFLQQAISGANFPYINANVVDKYSSKPLFKPYIILNKNLLMNDGSYLPIKIGVIGFVPPQIMEWDRFNLQGKVKVLDIIATAQLYIPQMKKDGADIIIAVPHSGLKNKLSERPLNENVVLDLAQLKGIDAILFGHAHSEFPSSKFVDFPKVDIQAGKINQVPAVMAGFWGNNLGIIDFRLSFTNNSWHIESSNAWLAPIYSKKINKELVAKNPQFEQLIESWQLGTLKYMRTVIALSKNPIYSYFSLVEPSNVDMVIHDAQLWYAKQLVAGTPYDKLPILSAVAPFKSGGRQGNSYYTDISSVMASKLEAGQQTGCLNMEYNILEQNQVPWRRTAPPLTKSKLEAGQQTGCLNMEEYPIARKSIADIYVYPNTIAILKVNGRDIKNWLEMATNQFNTIESAGKNREQFLINYDFPTYNFDNIAGDGFSYTIDVSKPPRYDSQGNLINKFSSRIKAFYKGKVLYDDTEFLVVTNNYRANGGGDFPGINATKIVLQSQVENREVIGMYLNKVKNIAAVPLKNWGLLPFTKPVYFITGSGALKYLPWHPEFKLVEKKPDGSIVLQLQ